MNNKYVLHIQITVVDSYDIMVIFDGMSECMDAYSYLISNINNMDCLLSCIRTLFKCGEIVCIKQIELIPYTNVFIEIINIF